MNAIAKLLIVTGVLLIAGGVLWQFGGRYLHLGRLPGDIVVTRGRVQFHFPVMTSIVISILLSFILFLFRLLGR